MTHIIQKLYRLQARIRVLRTVMPLWDAIKLVLAGNRPGEVQIYLRLIGREVVIRRGTTDLICLEKVFIENDYSSPFELSPRIIVDAGANVGMATLFFAHRYPEARIVAIEPEPMNFQMLERNCSGLPNVTFVRAALWSESAALRIKSRGDEAWGFYVVEGRCDFEGSVAASVVTIPEILRRLNSDQIDLLKLDIEGSERQLFSKGAERWLGQVRHIVIELHDRYLEGCAQAFYAALTSRSFVQEIRGENIFVRFNDGGAAACKRQVSQCSEKVDSAK